MGKEKVSRKILDDLISHVDKIKEERDLILEKYYPYYTEERAVFEKLMDEYIEKLEEYISGCGVEEGDGYTCPYSLIGSIVEVVDLEDNEIERYQIVSPFDSNVSGDYISASYLSPMGKALLLKRKDEIVDIKTPMGDFTYKVKSINFLK